MSQSALQLYAIFALKKISSLQAVSLVFSILSMLMTGYVFCRTFALPEMVLKYLFVCHDLFSAYYIFATVFGNLSSPGVALGQLAVDCLPQLCSPAMALWYGFCNNATTMNEFYNRCRYISLRLIDQLLSAQAHGLTQLNDETTTANDVSSPRRALWITQSFHMLVRNPPQQSFDALPLLAAPEYHPLAIFRALLNHLFPKYHLNCNPRIWYEKLLIDAIMICRVLYFFGQLFSIIFPFLHFIIYRGHQNLLQCFCFYGAAGTMFVIICLAPRIYRFVLFGLFHLPQAMLL